MMERHPRLCSCLLHAACVGLVLACIQCGPDSDSEPTPLSATDGGWSTDGVSWSATDGGVPPLTDPTRSRCNSFSNPTSSPPSKFSTPVWDPTAQWEQAGYYQGSTPQGDLDGPIRDIIIRNLDGVLSTNAPMFGTSELTCLFHDTLLKRAHAVAGSARGYLDGPFSRARFLGADRCRPNRGSRARTRDGQYIFITEPHAKQALRRIDFGKQQVTTLLKDKSPTLGLAVTDTELYVVAYDNTLTVMDFDGKPKRKVKLVLPKATTGKPAIIGGWGCKLLVDASRRRLYGARAHNSTIPHSVWYWNIDTGAFTSLVPYHKEGTVPRTGPLNNIGWYPDLWGLYFGPDDPNRLQIYVHVDHCGGTHRIDLQQKKVWGMRLDKTSNRIKWVTDGVDTSNWSASGYPRWIASTGNFYVPSAGSRGPNLLYKRVK